MENLFKKEYEISLWEDVLYWHRRKLDRVIINEDNYEPGKFYSQSTSSDVYGAKPYELDTDPYDANKQYYELSDKSEGKYLEGSSPEDISISYNEDWYENGTMIPNTFFQFFKEQKICTIGSDTMETPIRAHNPKLVANTNGSSTLTFTLYYKYYDEEADELIDNPFVKLLVNERKLKLRHGELGAESTKWYDFVIKNIQEDSESKAFTYTAKDLFINELSKSGFDVELDAKLENNQGTILELGRRVLKDSDWQIPDKADIHLQQTKSEALYEFTLRNNIQANSMSKEGGSVSIESGEKIYGFYNCVAEKLPFFQFLYYPNEEYETDEERHITNSPNYYVDNTEYTENGFPTFTINRIGQELSVLSITTKYRGKRIVRQPTTVFDPIMDRYVSVYTEKNNENKVVYGFVEDEIVSPTYVRNFVVNPNDFDSLTGWDVSGSLSNNEVLRPELELATIPDIFNGSYSPDTTYVSYLKLGFNNSNQGLVNFGITENRSLLNGFTKGKEFIFRIKYGIMNNGNLIYKNDNGFNIQLNAKVYKYNLKNGVYEIDEEVGTILDFGGGELSSSREEDRQYFVKSASCQKSMSYSDMTKSKFALYIYPASSSGLIPEIYIEDVQLFYVERKDSILVYPGDVIDTNVIREKYKYYYKPSEEQIADEIKFIYEGATPSENFVQKYNDKNNYEKVRSITASESNRFNLIQDLCEIFECWPQFTIDHDILTGEISLDKNYRQCKWVTFKEFLGKPNDIGFRYGINLKSIKRTIDSDTIVTKMIVKNNANEHATDGFCSIARATESPNRENFLLEFDYYISQKLLDFDQIWNDLYTKTNGYIGYYVKLKEINIIEDKLITEQSGLVIDEPNLEADVQTFQVLLSESNSILSQKRDELKTYTGYTFEQIMNESADETIQDWREDKNAKALCAAIAKLEKSIKTVESNLVKSQENLEINKSRQKEIEEQLTNYKNKKLALDLQFYKKYSRFLQEGSWIDENYVDDNLYYLDAESTLYTSAHPKITYDINVLELSKIPEYENYIFNLGDKTFIEDIEFFGWEYSGNDIRQPRHEEIIVNEITIMLDSPEQNQIKVQNYKTQFEDLFQRITATTQAVEYSTGKYEKVTQIIQPDGTIIPDTLSNSMANNSFIISNARDQSVTWDESGITTVSLSNPTEMVRIISGGIFLSKDGGNTWHTGITGNGINANYITSGQLDTSKIRIMAGAFPSFRWDSIGLNAYEFVLSEDGEAGTDFNSSNFIRFDQYGLYGIQGISNFNPLIANQDGKIGEDKIWDQAKFALTWRGFVLNNDNGSVRISSNSDIQVLDDKIERIKIGRIDGKIENGDAKYVYGLRISDAEGAPVMETDDSGKLWLKNKLNIESYEQNKNVSIGKIDTKESKDEIHGGRVIDANSNFIVYEDGYVKTLTGWIGGLTIQELVDGGYSVNIESDSGFVYKNGEGEKTFHFQLLRGQNDVTSEVTAIKWFLDGQLKSTDFTVTILGSEIENNNSAKLSCVVWLSEKEE